ncbi:MAG TPA: hypothetical protein VG722_13295, partial [Tepidisphaeraceae bacterium]|nr:hypothetical protein [Tepidisphaeraceae bacterium]
MPEKYTGRVVLILVVLFAALWAIFPNANVYHPDLKPGIDMAGGTSLLYEIKVPPGTAPNPRLSEEVMEALKKRVDPNGVRNLVWRPQGADRLEIEMPLTGNEAQNEAIREKFADAQRQLDATDVREGQVLHVVQDLKGVQRTNELKTLVMGWPR